MKKNILSALMLLTAILLSAKIVAADSPSKVWTFPVICNYDEEVTWYFDMSGTAVQEGIDLYLWAWQPSEPDKGNYTNSSEFAKLEYVGDMIWKKTLVPTEYFKVTVDQIWNHSETSFYMQLKTKSGDYATGTIAIAFPHLFVNTFKNADKAVQIVSNTYKESESKADILENKFYMDEPLTILVNTSLLWSGGNQGYTGEELHLHSGLDTFDEHSPIAQYQSWIPESAERTKLKTVRDGILKIDFIPRTYFGMNNVPPVAEDYVMQNISFLFAAKDWAKTYADKSGNFIIYAPDAPIPPAPVFYYFPQKFSQLDMLTLVRKNNERATSLEYTITAGTKTIKGDFSGTMTELRAHVNLLSELNNIGPINKIGLVIKRNGTEILKTDIPLVPTSELE